MRFACQIEMNSAAFADISDVTYSVEDEDGIVPPVMLAAGSELARILHRVADEAESGDRWPLAAARPLLDVNGRPIGGWSVVDDEESTFVVFRTEDSLLVSDGYVTFKTADAVRDAAVIRTP